MSHREKDAELKQHIGNMAKHQFNLLEAMLYYFNPIAFDCDGEAEWGGLLMCVCAYVCLTQLLDSSVGGVCSSSQDSACYESILPSPSTNLNNNSITAPDCECVCE